MRNVVISIHKALASLDEGLKSLFIPSDISIHKALASLDGLSFRNFSAAFVFQSTRLSRSSTADGEQMGAVIEISIHKALASLDAGCRGKISD